jgi:hypothetical protein
MTQFQELWKKIRQRRLQRVYDALDILEKTKSDNFLSQYIGLGKNNFDSAIQKKRSQEECSWFLIRCSIWKKIESFIPKYSYYSSEYFSKNTEYILIQSYFQYKEEDKLKNDLIHKDIYYLTKEQTLHFIPLFFKDYKISQFLPLTRSGLPDGWHFFMYPGGTNEGILIYDKGTLKEIRKRPFGTTLDSCIPLTECMIQEYRNMYKQVRGEYPDYNFSVLGEHDTMCWLAKNQLEQWLMILERYLNDTDYTRRLLICYRA